MKNTAYLLIICFICLYITYNLFYNLEFIGKEQNWNHIKLYTGFVFENHRLNEFKKIHEDNMLGNRQLKLSLCRVDSNGYANRMYCILTSLAVAILTDRAFLIDYKGLSIGNYIKEPFLNSFSNSLNGIDLSMLFDLKHEPNEIVELKPKFSWRIPKNIDEMIQTKLPENKTRLLFHDIKAYFYEFCSNPIYYKKLYYYGLIQKSTLNEAYQVTKNISFIPLKEKSIATFRVGFEVGGNLLRNVWLVQDNINNLVDQFINEHFKGYYVIGIQFRTAFFNEPNKQYNHFIACCEEIEKNLTHINKKNDFSYKNNSFKWFLASDSYEIRMRLLDLYPEKVVSIDLIENTLINDLMVRTLVDLELLSRTDELIVSGGSTFGWLASMKALKLPFFLNGKSINMTRCTKTDLFNLPARDDDFIFK